MTAMVTVARRNILAAVFDLDGVVTDTASVHAAAWKQLFDEVLSEITDGQFRPFGDSDYRRYVDGRSRREGVRSFLESRGIALSAGTATDPPLALTMTALAARKDRYFRRRLNRDGAAPFADAVALLTTLRAAKVPLAIASASRHCVDVLRAAHVEFYFDARVDGVVAEELLLASKPSPDLFLEAVRRLRSDPAQTMLVEDAVAGIEAGKRGGFGLVVGVDRSGQRDALVASGADIVVGTLTELTVAPASLL
jgi:beta-phosphoglucomutase family hydrolase